MIAATPQAALVQRLHVPAARVRCGGDAAGRVMCLVTERGKHGRVVTFYSAVRWRSDGRWHFTLVGAVA